MAIFPQVVLNPIMKSRNGDDDPRDPITRVEVYGGVDGHAERLGNLLEIDNTVELMGWRMSCSLERWEALRHVFLREGYRMNETGEVAEWYQKKIRWRMSSHWVEILPDGQMKSFAKQIIFPQNAAGITQILSNPAILRQSIYREACYTPGPLQDLLYSLMICAPGLLSLCFRMESPFPDREIDLVIFLPPQPWVRANERWVRYILGRRPYQNLCELPWSERYVLRERFD